MGNGTKMVPNPGPRGPSTPKSILEVSKEVKVKRSCFWRPWGRLEALLEESIWESKTVPNPSRKHFQDATEFEAPFGRFWDVSEVDFEVFLKWVVYFA